MAPTIKSLKEGSRNDAFKLPFGIKHLTGNVHTVKLRFTEDIADKLNTRLAGFRDLAITGVTSKGHRTIYGLIDASDLYRLQHSINLSKAERLERQAEDLRNVLKPIVISV